MFNADEGTKITGEEEIATGEKKDRRKRLKIAYDIAIIVALPYW